MKSTYSLEGDGILILKCFEEIVKIQGVIQHGRHPNLEAISQSIAAGNAVIQQQWLQHGLGCVKPGLDYFLAKYVDDTKAPLNVFKAARYFSPPKAFEMQLSASSVDSLKVIPFLDNPQVITSLKEELSTYLAKIQDVSPDIDILNWWKRNQEHLPHTSAAAKKVFLIQPSSAASENY